MNVSQEIAAGIQEVESLNPTLVYIPVGGPSYPCSIGTSRAGSKLGEGGWGSDADQMILVRLSIIPVLPVLKSKLTLKGKTLRIDDITTDPTGAYVVFTCVDPTRGV